MDSLTLITSKKYKTIGELLKSPIKSIILVSNNEKNEDIKSYLYDWLYKNHYSKIKMIGNLTTRIKNISNKPCYNYIMKECFNNIDYANFNKTTKQILDDECIQFIKTMHSTDSSLTGTFLDYLVRRIICEITQKKFQDSRANSNAVDTNYISSLCWRETDEIRNTHLPLNMLESYNKTQDIISYPTQNILLEVFITSLSHSLAFGGCPKQESVDSMVKLLQNDTNIVKLLIIPLQQLCLDLLKESPNVLLNPALGYPIELLDNKNIPADCDLVINNYLYDIKCTSGENSVYEILQLLGYASLLNCNSRFNNNVDNISIINLLQGHIVNYDISYITKDQMVNYLRFLTK